MAGTLRLKRIYDAPTPADGQRILVDRIWPRGVKRETAALTLWLKEIAPTADLRKWFGHDPARFAAFRDRYRKELDANPQAVAQLRACLDKGDATLLFGARDTRNNQAAVLAEYMQEQGYRFLPPS